MNLMIKIVLFDLDGTLLPMEQEEFVKAYFGGLAKKAAPCGYNADELIKTVWAGTAAMVKNNGTKTNEQVFWEIFAEKYGKDALKDKVIFDRFYENEFEYVKNACGFNPQAKDCIEKVKKMGFRTALATNPIFPETATRSRIRWAGLNVDDFEIYTTYENSRWCKPNPNYYKEVTKKLNVVPEECLMVGNDVEEDMIAAMLGMKVFLITDCIINKNNKDISIYPNGSFAELTEYLKGIKNGKQI